MTNPEVEIICGIEEINSGRDYKGLCEINDSEIEFLIHFTVYLGDLVNEPPPNNIIEMRKIIPIEIKKDGKVIELTDEEYAFFNSLIFKAIATHFYKSKIQDPNSSLKLAATGFFSFCQLSLETCTMLTKFGCKFSTINN